MHVPYDEVPLQESTNELTSRQTTDTDEPALLTDQFRSRQTRRSTELEVGHNRHTIMNVDPD